MPQIDPSVAIYVDAYVAGWALSRRTAQPQPVKHGWHVLTGTETEPERHVLTRGTAEDVRRVMNAMPSTGSYVKFAGNHQEWIFLADAEWEADPTGWFMTCDLSRGGSDLPLSPPVGDLITATIEDRVARIEVRHDGEVIASGRAGLAGEWAVPDRIRTEEAYRRRGLGLFVMRRLLGLAAEAGAQRAALNASSDGRELYQAMGWTTVAQQIGLTRKT
ncbi:GNAT family N-acetyltransferase [Rhizocola hellebori]|uniref:GNAT family N-acetyltransferase n=1 Tax=Rhizocola hellebori TaxID=1392758 RepID=UPI001940616B|nr:GNAT family N-acetyltransferase [Rhizocola hellebori]